MFMRPTGKRTAEVQVQLRNKKIGRNAEALIAIWDGQSKGTKNMIDTATKKGLLVFVKRVEPS